MILGGGVGGLAAAIHLERLCGRGAAEITLVSRDNFFLLSPLLFEACSGVLDFRHCAQPIRPCLRTTRFIEATVDAVDPLRQIVHAVAAEGGVHELPYDYLVVALGATTNTQLIPGSEHARTFKTVADALRLRNHLIERFERADIETDPWRKRQQLTVIVIGGGLVGTELLGELTAFASDILHYYPHVRPEDLSFHLFEAGERLLPESMPCVADYAERLLRRRGARIHTATRVQAIEPGGVRARNEFIAADTVVLAAGIVPSPASAAIPVERDRRGRIATDASLRSVSHPGVWAIGDCAAVPGPDGQPYPALAQHAVREARAVARNVHAAVMGRAPEPFVFRSLGTMAAFGHSRAAADVRGIHISGFAAWWMRRTYYLSQMPRRDTRLRIALDWTIALFFRPDLTKVDLAEEHEQELRNRPAGTMAPVAPSEPSGRTIRIDPGIVEPQPVHAH
ncbi:MAG: NAD(P)/FAD-dependent oxidoreductase [Gemmatimonadetes bacterium]|nr:NAD(P)/FAD-dependent oxidoreductase [Gemmatimonadota bacterium]